MKSDDLQKHTLNLFRGDYERLQLLYPDIGAGPVIRRVVHQFVLQCEAGATARPDELPRIDL